MERVKKIKEKPLIDERIPHPYRDVLGELRSIREELEEIKERLAPPPAPPVAPPVAPPAVPPLPPEVEDIIRLYREGLSIRKIAERLRMVESEVRRVVRLIPITTVVLTPSTIRSLAEEIAVRLIRLPNRVRKIEFDTSNTRTMSLKGEGLLAPPTSLGFEVEDVGGGFTYIIVRDGYGKDERTALAGDKWVIEFDDLLVRGSGLAGTARIWYWWRAVER